MMDDDDKRKVFRREEDKELVKEAIKEWLNEQFSSFGKWSAIGIASMMFYLFAQAITSSAWWPK